MLASSDYYHGRCDVNWHFFTFNPIHKLAVPLWSQTHIYSKNQLAGQSDFFFYCVFNPQILFWDETCPRPNYQWLTSGWFRLTVTEHGSMRQRWWSHFLFFSLWLNLISSRAADIINHQLPGRFTVFIRFAFTFYLYQAPRSKRRTKKKKKKLV